MAAPAGLSGTDDRRLLDRGDVGIVHVHSDYSHDGHDTLTSLRDRSVARGIRFVGLTDHAEDFDEGRFETFLAECDALSGRDITLVPGLEYRMRGRRGLHLLAIGLRRFFRAETPDEFFAGTRGAEVFTVMAHPGLAGYLVPPEVEAGIDAVEVWNAAYNTRYLPDPRALYLLRRLRRARPAVVAVAGLDQHDARNDRQTRVVLTAAAPMIPAALRAGHFSNRGRTMRFNSSGDFTPNGLLALQLARSALDVVERTQDRTTRALRRLRQRLAARGHAGDA